MLQCVRALLQAVEDKFFGRGALLLFRGDQADDVLQALLVLQALFFLGRPLHPLLAGPAVVERALRKPPVLRVERVPARAPALLFLRFHVIPHLLQRGFATVGFCLVLLCLEVSELLQLALREAPGAVLLEPRSDLEQGPRLREPHFRLLAKLYAKRLLVDFRGFMFREGHAGVPLLQRRRHIFVGLARAGAVNVHAPRWIALGWLGARTRAVRPRGLVRLDAPLLLLLDVLRAEQQPAVLGLHAARQERLALVRPRRHVVQVPIGDPAELRVLLPVLERRRPRALRLVVRLGVLGAVDGVLHFRVVRVLRQKLDQVVAAATVLDDVEQVPHDRLVAEIRPLHRRAVLVPVDLQELVPQLVGAIRLGQVLLEIDVVAPRLGRRLLPPGGLARAAHDVDYGTLRVPALPRGLELRLLQTDDTLRQQRLEQVVLVRFVFVGAAPVVADFVVLVPGEAQDYGERHRRRLGKHRVRVPELQARVDARVVLPEPRVFADRPVLYVIQAPTKVQVGRPPFRQVIGLPLLERRHLVPVPVVLVRRHRALGFHDLLTVRGQFLEVFGLQQVPVPHPVLLRDVLAGCLQVVVRRHHVPLPDGVQKLRLDLAVRQNAEHEVPAVHEVHVVPALAQASAPLLVLHHERGVPLVAVADVPKLLPVVPVALHVVLHPRALHTKLLPELHAARDRGHRGVAVHQLRDGVRVERVVHVRVCFRRQRVPQRNHCARQRRVLCKRLAEIDEHAPAGSRGNLGAREPAHQRLFLLRAEPRHTPPHRFRGIVARPERAGAALALQTQQWVPLQVVHPERLLLYRLSVQLHPLFLKLGLVTVFEQVFIVQTPVLLPLVVEGRKLFARELFLVDGFRPVVRFPEQPFIGFQFCLVRALQVQVVVLTTTIDVLGSKVFAHRWHPVQLVADPNSDTIHAGFRIDFPLLDFVQ